MSGTEVQQLDRATERLREVLSAFPERESEYREILSDLGPLVSYTSKVDDFLLSNLAGTRVLDNLSVILRTSVGSSKLVPENILELYYRTWRAAIVLVRNLSAHGAFGLDEVMASVRRFIDGGAVESSFFLKTMVIYLQALANVSYHDDCKGLVPELEETFFKHELLMQTIENDDQARLAMAQLLSKVFVNSENTYELLHLENNHIISYIAKEFHHLNLPNHHIDFYGSLLVRAFLHVICHESYGKWLESLGLGSPSYLEELKISQLIITYKEDWSDEQIVGLLSWLFESFSFFATEAKAVLLSEKKNIEEITRVHSNLVILLDCLSDLGKFETCKSFLLHYNALKILVDLLRIVSENVQRKRLRDQSNTSSKEDIAFPHIKSLVIEIITFIVYDCFEAQEKVRELHGVELILSSCVIDANDPFMKERSIVCLKFLLKDNPANQQIVADLEQKDIASNEALQEAGYEVELEKGKVKLKLRGKDHENLK